MAQSYAWLGERKRSYDEHLLGKLQTAFREALTHQLVASFSASEMQQIEETIRTDQIVPDDFMAWLKPVIISASQTAYDIHMNYGGRNNDSGLQVQSGPRREQ
jgi:hypothetical protein